MKRAETSIETKTIYTKTDIEKKTNDTKAVIEKKPKRSHFIEIVKIEMVSSFCTQKRIRPPRLVSRCLFSVGCAKWGNETNYENTPEKHKKTKNEKRESESKTVRSRTPTTKALLSGRHTQPRRVIPQDIMMVTTKLISNRWDSKFKQFVKRHGSAMWLDETTVIKSIVRLENC